MILRTPLEDMSRRRLMPYSRKQQIVRYIEQSTVVASGIFLTAVATYLAKPEYRPQVVTSGVIGTGLALGACVREKQLKKDFEDAQAFVASIYDKITGNQGYKIDDRAKEVASRIQDQSEDAKRKRKATLHSLEANLEEKNKDFFRDQLKLD